MKTTSKSALLSLAVLFAADARAGTPAPFAGMPESVSVPSAQSPLAKGPHAMLPYHGTLAPGMTVEGINDQGWIIGHWTDANGMTHWFLLNPFLPTFSDISRHGQAQVQLFTASQSSS
jgi:hypothetical protein